MLEKLFESIDKSVLTDEVKTQITEEFQDAVEQKAEEIANEKIAEKEKALNEKFEKKLDELDEECENLKAELEESANQRIEKLDQLAEEYVDGVVKELTESNQQYIEKSVNDFIDECYADLKSDLDVEKCKALNESFSNFALLAGVDADQIANARDESSYKTQLEEMTAKYNDAINESMEKDAQIEHLQNERNMMLKAGVIAEMSEGLSLVEKDKFVKSAELVEFSADKSYADRLQLLKESITSDVNTSDKLVNESVDEKPAKKSTFDERLARFF